MLKPYAEANNKSSIIELIKSTLGYDYAYTYDPNEERTFALLYIGMC